MTQETVPRLTSFLFPLKKKIRTQEIGLVLPDDRVQNRFIGVGFFGGYAGANRERPERIFHRQRSLC